MRKICVVISARASYARIKTMLENIEQNENLSLEIILIGSSILEKYGDISASVEAKFKNVFKIHTSFEPGSASAMAKSTGVSIIELSNYFSNSKPDIVITIADRYETISTSIASSYQNICLVHIQGGEITGNIDEKVRHANSKFADYHFVSNEIAKKRLRQLGEEPSSIFNVGCPSIDIANQLKKNRSLDFNPFEKYGGVGNIFDIKSNDYLVLLQHPVTNENLDSELQMSKSLEAIKKTDMYAFIFWPNIDSGTSGTSKAIRKFRENYFSNKIHYFKNFSPEDFLKLLMNSSCLIGNSSTGIRECSFLGIPVVNIGSRQNGRLRGSNVIDVNHDINEIYQAIIKCSETETNSQNLYGNGNAGFQISQILEKLTLKNDKRFIDIL